MDWGNLFTGIGAGLAGLGGGFFVRRSAKEANTNAAAANARELYSGLSTTQTAELIRLSTRVEAMDKALDQAESERAEARKHNREHMKWDWIIVGELRAARPGSVIPDPPPLDV